MSGALVSPRNFPALSGNALGRKRHYFDHACLTPAPREVADAVAAFYKRWPGCPLRSATGSTTDLEERIRDGRDAVRAWINARFSDEIVFTANTTLGINIIASAVRKLPGEVLITDLEHNSNRLPWLDQDRCELAWPPGTDFPLEEYQRALNERRIKLVSILGTSNLTGQSTPLAEIIRAAHEREVPVHVDAAQMAVHARIDVGSLRPDFLTFSLHKCYGPTGLGVLYLRRALHDRFHPTISGGGSVDDTHDDHLTPAAGPARFEFGLQNYSSLYAVPETMAFLKRFDRSAIEAHFAKLNARARARLSEVPGVRLVGCGHTDHDSSIVNFHCEGKDSMRLAELMDLAGGIQVRAGRLCVHHYYHRYQLPPSIRMSFGYHNTEEEVDLGVQTLRTLVDRYL
jgi:cysteine desulfurase / selenocysteine lyase